MNSLLIENQYFGSVNYYKLLFQYKYIIIEKYEYYQKMSFRNRCYIPGANGVVGLSVPLEKGRDQKALIKDVRIAYRENWVLQHIRTIESVYNRAPFFEFYRDELVTLLERRPVYLFDLNFTLMEWIFKKLGAKAEISLSDSYQKDVPNTVFDGRNSVTPKHVQGNHNHPYTQVFEDRVGYQSNMSILDLLFCSGKQSIHLLTDSKNLF